MSEKSQPYKVLARKYRPQNFAGLIGQDALVRTLRNSIETGRIAHAFMLTGVRGVGKTTTARIIAKSLNYAGPDGNAGPTAENTDDCPICRAISEDRHPDVIEMDAASRNSVEDIRDILDGVRYAPTEARYKIYIIDEVHMLSKQAFNALLKTLEEPPEHVKFIFATTEIRKVPITVLSRCQRFDLRRVDTITLVKHFQSICAQENVSASDEALSLIARAADGSVRDGLSLLDQAIALAESDIKAQLVQDMLGLGDKAKTIDVLDACLKGEAETVMALSDDLYSSGGDPIVMMQDLLETSHVMARLRVVKQGQKNTMVDMAADQIQRLNDMAQALPMPVLGRAWQIFLKGLHDVKSAPNPKAALEMVLLKLCYASDLPDPADLVRKLKDGEYDSLASTPTPPSASFSSGMSKTVQHRASSPIAQAAGTALAPAPEIETAQALLTSPQNLHDLVIMLEQNGAMILASHVYHYVHPVIFEDGRLEYRGADDAPEGLPQELVKTLQEITGKRWIISISGQPGMPTLAEQEVIRKQNEREEIEKHPLVCEVKALFPGAEITAIEDQ